MNPPDLATSVAQIVLTLQSIDQSLKSLLAVLRPAQSGQPAGAVLAALESTAAALVDANGNGIGQGTIFKSK